MRSAVSKRLDGTKEHPTNSTSGHTRGSLSSPNYSVQERTMNLLRSGPFRNFGAILKIQLKIKNSGREFRVATTTKGSRWIQPSNDFLVWFAVSSQRERLSAYVYMSRPNGPAGPGRRKALVVGTIPPPYPFSIYQSRLVIILVGSCTYPTPTYLVLKRWNAKSLISHLASRLSTPNPRMCWLI